VGGIYCVVVGVAPVDPIVAAFPAFPYSDSHFDRDVAAAPAGAGADAVGIAAVADDSDVAASGADNFVPKIAPVADAAAAAATVDDRDARRRNTEA